MVGAGLAGLACARDLALAGTDVLVLEARDRPGGRVEQEWLADGRPVQFGGELTAEWQVAYTRLVGELGLTLEPSYTAIDLPYAWGADEGVAVGEWRALDGRGRPRGPRARRLGAGRALARRRPGRSLEPSGRRAARLAERRRLAAVGGRAAGRDPPRRAHGTARCRSIRSSAPRCSLSCARRRRRAGAASTTRATGRRSARGRGLGHAWRCGWRRSSASACAWAPSVAAIDVGVRRAARSRWRAASGSSATAVVSAMPVGPLRDVAITGVSERAAALAAQPAQRAGREDGGGLPDVVLGGRRRDHRRRLVVRLDPARRASSRRSRRPTGSAPSWRTSAAAPRDEFLEVLAALIGERGARPDPLRRAHLGARPVHAGLRDRLAARAT